MKIRRSHLKPSPGGIRHGKQYPGVQGKVVDWVDHAFAEGALYLHVRFTDKTELSWRIGTSLVVEEADLSDWKTGNFKQLAVFKRAAQGNRRKIRSERVNLARKDPAPGAGSQTRDRS